MVGSGALLAFLLASLLSACGVDFGSGQEGTELFASLTVEGERVAGSPLTLRLDYTQIYPAPIAVRCFLEQDDEEVQAIGESTVPPHPEGGPEATPTPGIIELTFAVERPGSYWVVCETPADENNAIGERLEILPATAARLERSRG